MTLKTWGGIAAADIKTYQGIAKASVKVVNGEALPAGGDPSWANVKLLIINDNAANGSTTFTDQSSSPHTVTVSGNASYSSASPPTGMTTSGAFDGAGDFLTLDGSSDFAYGTGDFTVEGFLYAPSIPGTAGAIFDHRPSTTNGAYPALFLNTDGTLVYFVNNAIQISGGTVISTSTWYHWAISRSGTSTKLFLGGTQGGSTYSDSNNYAVGASRPSIAASGFATSANQFNGKLCSIRITNGTARYTANFTPPTLPMPNS